MSLNATENDDILDSTALSDGQDQIEIATRGGISEVTGGRGGGADPLDILLLGITEADLSDAILI